jgi:hypothetical protein
VLQVDGPGGYVFEVLKDGAPQVYSGLTDYNSRFILNVKTAKVVYCNGWYFS